MEEKTISNVPAYSKIDDNNPDFWGIDVLLPLKYPSLSQLNKDYSTCLPYMTL
jgi:hypothetical protein